TAAPVLSSGFSACVFNALASLEVNSLCINQRGSFVFRPPLGANRRWLKCTSAGGSLARGISARMPVFKHFRCAGFGAAFALGLACICQEPRNDFRVHVAFFDRFACSCRIGGGAGTDAAWLAQRQRSTSRHT